MFTLTMSTRGQFVLPKEIREKLGLYPGCKIEGEIDANGRIVLRPKRLTVEEFLRNRPPRSKRVATLEEMDEAIAQGIRRGIR